MTNEAFKSLNSIGLLNGKPKSYINKLTHALKNDAAQGFEATEAYLIQLCRGRLICDDGTLIRCGWPQGAADTEKEVLILYGGTHRILIEPDAGCIEEAVVSDVSPFDAAAAAVSIIKKGRRAKQSIAAYHMFATLNTVSHQARVWPALEGIMPQGAVLLGVPSPDGQLLYAVVSGHIRDCMIDWERAVKAGTAATIWAAP